MSGRRRRPGRPRIAVYAIARDEAGQVERWTASARAADVMLIADTGSTDATLGRARELGVAVHEVSVAPFRFDEARNLALDLVPKDVDICVSLDLDEVLLPGWRNHLEEAWRQGATRIRCRYEWRWSETYPSLRYTADRIHARQGYRWRFPVHEQIVSSGAEITLDSAVEIHHLRDSSRARPSYLALLRLGVAEYPNDGRMAHLLANEARLNGRTAEASFEAHRVLVLDAGPHERLHAMLMLAHLEPALREAWIIGACAEFPERREPWCELAQLHSERGAWRACLATARAALRIESPADDYLTNVFAWGAWPERLAAQAALQLGDHDSAVHHARRALRAAPDNGEAASLLPRSTGALMQTSRPPR